MDELGDAEIMIALPAKTWSRVIAALRRVETGGHGGHTGQHSLDECYLCADSLVAQINLAINRTRLRLIGQSDQGQAVFRDMTD